VEQNMKALRVNLNAVLIAAAIISLIGGYLLHVAADPTSGAGTSLTMLIIGIILIVAVGGVLYRLSRPGHDLPSEDEVAVPESGWGRFLRISKLAASLYLGLRLAMAYEWLSAGWEKLQSPGWTQTGASLQAFWQKAVAVPKTGSPAITYPAYRGFIQFMLDQHWYTWFAKIVVTGELLIGLTLLLGAFTGFAALAGLLMNFNFVYAGSTSINPTLIILEALVLYGWRVAGWYGLDRFLLPSVGTPWAPGAQEKPAIQTAAPTGERGAAS
jgi:thiosulfate dehydrogenase (quinone) large subunit